MSISDFSDKYNNTVKKEHIVSLFDASLNYITTHVAVALGFAIGIMIFNVSPDPILVLMTIVTSFYAIIYASISSIYITQFVKYRNTRVSTGFKALRDSCTNLAFKN